MKFLVIKLEYISFPCYYADGSTSFKCSLILLRPLHNIWHSFSFPSRHTPCEGGISSLFEDELMFFTNFKVSAPILHSTLHDISKRIVCLWIWYISTTSLHRKRGEYELWRHEFINRRLITFIECYHLHHQIITLFGYARTSFGRRNRIMSTRKILASITTQRGELYSMGEMNFGVTISSTPWQKYRCLWFPFSL